MIIIFMMMLMMMMMMLMMTMMMICDNDDLHIFHELDFRNMLAHLTATAKKKGPSSKASPYCCSKAANFSCGRLDTYLPGN